MNLFKFRSKESDPDEENGIEGERELSSVNKGLTLQNKITNWAVICGACALAAVLLYKYYVGMYDNYRQSKEPTKDATRTVATTGLPPLAMPDPEPVKVAATVSIAEKLPPLSPSAAAPLAAGSTAPAGQPVKSLAQLTHERRLKSDVRFNLDGKRAGTGDGEAVPLEVATEPGASTPDTTPGAAPRPAIVRAGQLARAGQAANFAALRAYMLPDPTLMMTRGKTIPCTVVPAMDTTLTGIVTCITGEDATGADNKVSLMDRGTICAGKQGGGVTHGQRRVGIIWDRCETPQHVLVPLDAGATDALGRPGIPGQVNNHFWDRFGGAIALSLITDIGPYLVATKQGGSNNTTVAFPNITGPQQIMSEVLKSTIDIPPTIYGPQGAPVLIYLAGDVDFRDVYQLERTK